MSALVHDDYAPARKISAALQPRASLRRLLIAAAGCAVMALSGTGLANYLDTSSANADAATAPSAPLN